MTAFHRPWSYTPRRLKHVADLELALGVTRFCIHTSPHQPTQVPPPGIGLAPFLGQAFIRTEPWAELAGPWIDYLARCSWLLNQGVPGRRRRRVHRRGGPGHRRCSARSPTAACRPGSTSTTSTSTASSAGSAWTDGDLVAGETRYRLLYLGGQQRADDRARAAPPGRSWSSRGATVVGRRPVGSPSLADDDAEHARALRPAVGRRPVVDTDDLGAALDRLGLRPSLVVEGAELLRIGRRIAAARWSFLANPLPEPVDGDCCGRRRAAARRLGPGHPPAERASGTARIELPPLGSVFLVPGGRVDEPRGRAGGGDRARRRLAAAPCPASWRPSCRTGRVPWTELGPGGGRLRRRRHLRDRGRPRRPTVDGPAGRSGLGDVGDLARVRVNGTDCGVVWTAPVGDRRDRRAAAGAQHRRGRASPTPG